MQDKTNNCNLIIPNILAIQDVQCIGEKIGVKKKRLSFTEYEYEFQVKSEYILFLNLYDFMYMPIFMQIDRYLDRELIVHTYIFSCTVHWKIPETMIDL